MANTKVKFKKVDLSKVTPTWIKTQMTQLDLREAAISGETGLAGSYLSAMINGHKPLSNSSKRFLYYFFQYKKAINV